MSSGTLLSITISNYGPFAEPVTFSTVSDTTKKELLEENSFEIREERYNKVSYIYGANGAGKSNFCRAILQIQSFLSLAPIFAANNPQILEMSHIKGRSANLDNPYRFDKTYAQKPTAFSIEILLNRIIYTYSFETRGGKILKERLTKKNKRTEVILDRTSPSFSDIVLKSELKDFINNVSVVKENVLCLSMAAFLNIRLANRIVDAINSIEVVNMATTHKIVKLTEETCTDERIRKYVKVLQYADPTLQDIHIAFNEEKVERQKMNVPDLEDRELVVKSVQVAVESTHKIYDAGKEVSSCQLPFMQIESNGTIKLFGILPVIFDVLEQGGVLVIDEIENGLHPFVVKQIVNLFLSNDTNPLHAQLICTSHSRELIETKVRRDQVWIVSKAREGISTITRVSDIPGMRAYESNGYKYLETAFGGIPQNIFS